MLDRRDSSVLDDLRGDGQRCSFWRMFECSWEWGMGGTLNVENIGASSYGRFEVDAEELTIRV